MIETLLSLENDHTFGVKDFNTIFNTSNHKKRVTIQFEVLKSVEFGKGLYLTGSIQELGTWGSSPINMMWQKGDYWTCEVVIETLLKSFRFEYKFMISDYDINTHSHREFEPGPNRLFKKALKQTKNFKYIKLFWGRIFLVFRFYLPYDVNKLYITGNIPELGFAGRQHKNMIQKHKIDKENKWIKFWEYTICVKTNSSLIYYRYGLKKKKGDGVVWEREPNRLCNLLNLKQYANITVNPINDMLGVAQKETLFFGEKNNKFLREDANFGSLFFYTQIDNNLWLGPYPQSEEEYNRLSSLNIKAIFNLQSQEDFIMTGFSNEEYEEIYDRYNIHYENFPILDNDSTSMKINAKEASLRLKNLVDDFGQVYVHCTAGVNRSPKTIVMYLIWHQKREVKEAIDLVKFRRGQAKVDEKTIRSIIRFYNANNNWINQYSNSGLQTKTIDT